MRILISDEVSAACVETLQGHFTVDYRVGLSAEELAKTIHAYDGWVVRSATKVTAELIDRATLMKVIGRAGAGVDNIDVDAATRRGILVMNTPGGNTLSTAEHTVAMILSLSRNIPQADRSLKSGEWKRSRFTGTELYGKTLGVVGVGRVGREVAIRMKSFGMQLIGYDPILSQDEASRLGMQLVPFDELVADSDYITLHTPLTKNTEALINRDTLSRCRKGVRIINCARGGIVDEVALAEALRAGQVAGAALDVFAIEPPPKDHVLLSLPNVIVTPHLGASTEEAQEKVAIQVAEQMVDVLTGKTVRGAVNLMPIERDVLIKYGPYLDLCSRLGNFTTQIVRAPIRRIVFQYVGEISEYPTTLLSHTVLAGMLGNVVEQVNIVNAPLVARQHGIELAETRTGEHHDFTNLILVELTLGDGRMTLGGTLFGKNDPRIVIVDDYLFDSRLGGFMAVLSNEDKPGQIGRLGTVLGNHKINIAHMSLGRQKIGGRAMTILNLDQPMEEPVIQELTSEGFYGVMTADLTQVRRPYSFVASSS